MSRCVPRMAHLLEDVCPRCLESSVRGPGLDLSRRTHPCPCMPQERRKIVCGLLSPPIRRPGRPCADDIRFGSQRHALLLQPPIQQSPSLLIDQDRTAGCHLVDPPRRLTSRLPRQDSNAWYRAGINPYYGYHPSPPRNSSTILLSCTIAVRWPTFSRRASGTCSSI